jgi:hypothetical protein
MVDVGAIAGMLSAIKSARDLSKAVLDIRDEAMIRESIIALQGKLLDAQESAFDANDERKQLLDKIEALETEIKRLKALDGGGERCPSCGKSELRVTRSVLSPHFGDLGVRDHHLKCANCNFEDVRQVTR